jgi:small-conductance mechanosensitive channel
MSENEELENEEKITTKLKNTKTNDEISITTTPENAQKLKELLEAQNEQSNQIVRENAELKQKLSQYPEYQGAPLNSNQITGLSNEDIHNLVRDVLPSDNEGLPVDMMSFTDEFDMITQLEKFANSGNVEAKKALAKLVSKVSDAKRIDFEYDGNDTKALYRKLPKDPKERAEMLEKRKMWVKVK